MIEFFGWVVPFVAVFVFGVGADAPEKRRDVVYETHPGMEQPVAEALSERLAATGVAPERIRLKGEGAFALRITYTGWGADRFIGVAGAGETGVHHIRQAGLAACPQPMPKGTLCAPEPWRETHVLMDAASLASTPEPTRAEGTTHIPGRNHFSLRLSRRAIDRVCGLMAADPRAEVALVFADMVRSIAEEAGTTCQLDGQLIFAMNIEKAYGMVGALNGPDLPANVDYLYANHLAPNRAEARDFPGPPRRY